jgi:MinD-like ATPase involved in chromosome partitioning or flagellar assembly
MSERQSGAERARLSLPEARLRRLRVMTSGRWHPPAGRRRGASLIAVGAAQPGVGKSIVACNLAAAIAGLGRQVVLVDLDPSSPRQHALFGLDSPPGGLAAWLERKRILRDEPARATSVRNLRLLPSIEPADATLSAGRRRAIVDELYDLESDTVVVVDIGNDNRDDLFECFGTRAMRLLVTSRTPAALEATYAFLAGAVVRAGRRHGDDAPAVLERFCGGLVGNSSDTPEEVETLHAFARLVRAHLGIPLPVFGALRTSERIPQSIVARQPLIVRRGVDDNVRAFHHMAELAMSEDFDEYRDCRLDSDDGDDVVIAAGPLPEDLARYTRQHARHTVDWAATLDLGTTVTSVRVRDVSESGAGVETSLQLRVGDKGVLRLDQLPGQPSLPVAVKNVMPAARRVGLGFTTKGGTSARLVAAARDALAAAGPRERD